MSDDEPVTLGTIGDCTPLEYGGGFVFKYPDGRVQIEYAEEPCDDDPFFRENDRRTFHMPYRKAPHRLYVVDVAEDVKADLNWLDDKDWARIANHGNGESSKVEGERLAGELASEDPMVRAMLYWDVANQHGWDNLDPNPMTLTGEELSQRWNLGEEHWGDKVAEVQLWADQCRALRRLFFLLGDVAYDGKTEDNVRKLRAFLEDQYEILSGVETELVAKMEEAGFRVPTSGEDDEAGNKEGDA